MDTTVSQSPKFLGRFLTVRLRSVLVKSNANGWSQYPDFCLISVCSLIGLQLGLDGEQNVKFIGLDSFFFTFYFTFS